MSNSMKSPKVFISYAWEDDIKRWVHDFATRLRQDGVETILDQWGIAPGDSLPEFMEHSVNASDFVLIVCTPAYKTKSASSDPSGVGYEKGVITGELFVERNQRKFIPILRKGNWSEAAPPWLNGKIYIDLRRDPYDEENYQELLRTLYGQRELPPPLGARPDFSKKKDTDEVSSKAIKEIDNSVPMPGQKTVLKKELHPERANQLIIFVKHYYRVIGGFFAVTLFVVGWILFRNPLGTVPTPTPVLGQTIVSLPSAAPPGTLAAETSIPLPTVTHSNFPKTGKDDMVLIYIPAGEFTMGSIGNDADERPVHSVYLDAFLIDKTEVTNAMYATCVESGRCNAPRLDTSITQNAQNDSFYYGNPEYDHFPVIFVSWYDANAYCEWAGRRLPTEAEWEKAARWGGAKHVRRSFPWGNKIDCSYANYRGKNDGKELCVEDTTPVGSYLKGASFYGVLDMAGNVWEWVLDRYSAEYYGDSEYRNPTGPSSGDYIVIRGGSFLTGWFVGIRSSDRNFFPPDSTSQAVGFRCAMDASP